MKTIQFIITILLIGSFSFLQAQITLSQSDFPSVGTSLKLYRVDTDSAFNLTDSTTIGSPGANGVYDFSKLLPLAQDSFQLDYVTPASTGWATNHPTADFAAFIEVETDSASGDTIILDYAFYKVDANKTEQVGITLVVDTAGIFSGTPSGIFDTLHSVITPPDTIVDAAYNLGYMNTDFSMWSVTLGFRVHEEQMMQTIEVDGWGDLTNPWGTFSVLRVKVMTIDSSTNKILGVPIDTDSDTSWTFEYWANGIGHELVSVETDPSYTNVWLVTFVEASPMTSIAPTSNGSFDLYPNPTNGIVTFNLNEISDNVRKISIYNILGNQEMEKIIAPGTVKSEMSVSHLIPGIYFTLFQQSNGKLLMTRKLIVE